MLKETHAVLPDFAEIEIEADFNWRECEDEEKSELVPVVRLIIKRIPR